MDGRDRTRWQGGIHEVGLSSRGGAAGRGQLLADAQGRDGSGNRAGGRRRGGAGRGGKLEREPGPRRRLGGVGDGDGARDGRCDARHRQHQRRAERRGAPVAHPRGHLRRRQRAGRRTRVGVPAAERGERRHRHGAGARSRGAERGPALHRERPRLAKQHGNDHRLRRPGRLIQYPKTSMISGEGVAELETRR